MHPAQSDGGTWRRVRRNRQHGKRRSREPGEAKMGLPHLRSGGFSSCCFWKTFFFCERGIWIKMKHSTNLPFYKEHPEIREKHTHILGSFHRHLPRWRHQPSSSAQCCPPPAAPRDTKTLEMPQELAPQTNHDALFPLNDHRPSRRQGKEMNNQSNATSRTNHPSVLITSAAKEKNPTKALTSQSNRRHHRR
jgi:hypothetical protein